MFHRHLPLMMVILIDLVKRNTCDQPPFQSTMSCPGWIELKYQNYSVALKMFRYRCLFSFPSFCVSESLWEVEVLFSSPLLKIRVALEQFGVIINTTGSFSTSFLQFHSIAVFFLLNLDVLCFPQMALFYLCMHVYEKLWNSLTTSILPCMYVIHEVAFLVLLCFLLSASFFM